MTVRVDDMVTQGRISLRGSTTNVNGYTGLFLRTGAKSVSTLNMRLAACKYQQGEEIFEWIAKLDSIYAQFWVARAEISEFNGTFAWDFRCRILYRVETSNAKERRGV